MDTVELYYGTVPYRGSHCAASAGAFYRAAQYPLEEMSGTLFETLASDLMDITVGYYWRSRGRRTIRPGDVIRQGCEIVQIVPAKTPGARVVGSGPELAGLGRIWPDLAVQKMYGPAAQLSLRQMDNNIEGAGLWS